MNRKFFNCKFLVTMWALFDVFFLYLNLLFFFSLLRLYLASIVMLHLDMVRQHILIIEDHLAKWTFEPIRIF